MCWGGGAFLWWDKRKNPQENCWGWIKKTRQSEKAHDRPPLFTHEPSEEGGSSHPGSAQLGSAWPGPCCWTGECSFHSRSLTGKGWTPERDQTKYGRAVGGRAGGGSNKGRRNGFGFLGVRAA